MISFVLYIIGVASGIAGYRYTLTRQSTRKNRKRYWIHIAHTSETGKLFVRTQKPIKNNDDWVRVIEEV